LCAGPSHKSLATIAISSLARIGKSFRLNDCVNIGLKDGKSQIIGDNVYIGPGAKLFGLITIGDNINIGTNAVVNRCFPANVTVAGVPAKIIKH
jgi:serine O-acetyltransferase